MSRFYAEIQGNRGEATRQGSAKSGMRSHTRGWRVGARVSCGTDFNDGDLDVVSVSVTGGSSRPSNLANVAEFRETEKGVEVILYHPKTGNVVARHEIT